MSISLFKMLRIVHQLIELLIEVLLYIAIFIKCIRFESE